MGRFAPFGEAIYAETYFGAPPLPPLIKSFAPFGEAIFGKTVFGAPIVPSLSVPLTVTPVGYSALQVNWTPPSQIFGQTLLRSSYGTPTTIYDGTVLLSEVEQATPQGPFSASFLDTDLLSGQFYYYALFVLVAVS